MILFHGTNISFDTVCLSKSRVGKDFGAGFYLTPDKRVAQRQADRKFAQNGYGFPTVLSFNWDQNHCDDINILKFEGYCLEWAEFVIKNRKNRSHIQIHDNDIVIGPIADDTIGFQIRRYEDGIISLNQFMEEIKYHKIALQYLFCTEKALKTLKKL